jgi:hypothetical protein
VEKLPQQSKARVASALLDRIEKLITSRPAKAGRYE